MLVEIDSFHKLRCYLGEELVHFGYLNSLYLLMPSVVRHEVGVWVRWVLQGSWLGGMWR